jgi:hypothetical protein
MCLSILVDNPDLKIESGEIGEYEYAITRNQLGYRCGYLKVLPGHSWYGKGYYDIDADVHGGLTFAHADKPCEQIGDDAGWWLGFDCAHRRTSGKPPDSSVGRNAAATLVAWERLYGFSRIGFSD